MIERIIDWSLENKFLVILGTLFLLAAGIYSMKTMPLDALPDLSDVQVIIFTEYPGQAPQVVEDQVTYPLTTAMLSVPFAKVVRGYSFFGFSMVYIIFDEGTDMYWARSRVLEYLNFVSGRLPKGVTPQLGPDATGVGWVFEYALVDKTGKNDLQQLRSIQDWFLRYELQTVPGVSEVASVGGYVKQYQVELDPNKLLAYKIPIQVVKKAILRSNNDVGGRLLERAEMEFMVRGLGYIKSVEDLKNVVVGASESGVPIRVRDLGRVVVGPELRRGVTELNGEGEVVGGVVVARFGENALEVIKGVKDKLKELQHSLPERVEIVPTYDRSNLILRSIENLEGKLTEEMIVVALVCAVFLFHLRSSLVAVIVLPLGILGSFIIMRMQGLGSNIMSLGGIAIAIGAMVDSSVVMVENAFKHLEHDAGKKSRSQIIRDAAVEVGPALFFALVIITVSFLPVFTLEAQEGRMFKPLAFTKTYAMAVAAGLSITLIPVLMVFFIRGKVIPEAKHPISRILIFLYRPVIEVVLNYKKTVIFLTLLILFITAFPFHSVVHNKLEKGSTLATISEKLTFLFPLEQIGSEFMPPLFEGDFLYMPTTLPGISVTKAKEILQQTDKIIRTFPEVHHVFGKIGRFETATDPAPLSMIETTITLKPKYREEPRKRFYEGFPDWMKSILRPIFPDTRKVPNWRTVEKKRFYSDWSVPEFLKAPLRWFWPEEGLITPEELSREMLKTLKIPGLTNATPLGPIKTRLDMLSTGIKTPLGIKVAGPDLEVLDKIATDIESVVQEIPWTVSAFAERVVGGNYVDINIDREAAARYGLTVGDVQDIIMSAVGGMNITTTVEGLERYPVNLRYGRGFRDNIPALKRVLVPVSGGKQVPLSQLASIEVKKGPPAIKSENSRLNAWVFVDFTGIDVGTYVKEAKRIVYDKVKIPPGYSLIWSGQYEYMERSKKRLQLVVPITLLMILLLLYLHFKNLTDTLIVMLTLPFAAVGSIWLMYWAGYNFSVAVGVGFIALLGLAASTGIVMVVYLDIAYQNVLKRNSGRMTLSDLRDAVIYGAVERVRPKMMTVATMTLGLIPIMLGHGAGSEIMKRIAAPMVGGLVTSTVLTLVVIPVVYALVKGIQLKVFYVGTEVK